jgi:HAD superfamily hydrolase (TIGR01459 family)
MKLINSIREILDNYQYYIIDLWGVLHDGHKPYPKAIETLKLLKNSGKKIALLSNAPRRAFKAKTILDNLGFSEDMYDLLLTSGEITFDFVKNNYPVGSKYFYIGPEKDRDLLNNLNMQEVTKAKDADFAVVTGFNGFESVFEERKYQADECLEAGLKLLCANPDRKVVKQTGEVQICAGILADYYLEKGGKVEFFGKPYQAGYQKIIEHFEIKNTAEILCVGDSIHTDIKGANSIGARGLFVCNGIHAIEVFDNNQVNTSKINNIAISEGAIPTYAIHSFF